MPLSPRRSFALHESGHAIVCGYFGVQVVSAVATKSGGRVEYLDSRTIGHDAIIAAAGAVAVALAGGKDLHFSGVDGQYIADDFRRMKSADLSV